jgi:hypothetical protein
MENNEVIFKKIRKYIFDLLDSDEDGFIDSQNVEINFIESNILEIIKEVLFEMED